MADIGPNLMMPDERAAGVISGSDPYRELELYLEKVNEEFGEVFERWLGSSELSKLKQNGDIKSSSQCPKTNASERTRNFVNGNQGKRKSREMKNSEIHEYCLNPYRTRSLPPKMKNGSGRNNQRLNNIYAYASEKAKADEKEWSDGLMADFEKLIALELNQLTIDAMKQEKNNHVFSASPNSDSSASTDSNSSAGSLKGNSKTFRRHFSEGSDDSVVKDGVENGDAVLIRVRPLGDGFQRRGSDSQLPPRRPKRIPSPIRIKEFFRSTSPFGRRGKKEMSNAKRIDEGRGSYKMAESDIPPPVPTKKKKNNEKKIPVGLQNLLTKIRPSGSSGRNRSPLRGESPGELSSGFNTMNSSIEDAEDTLDAILSSVSTATQTSPALSRSSSFTWMSDCSSSLILNTPGSLSDVNDEKSSSSGRSSSSPARIQCENGCGSECDCATTGSRDSSGESRDSGDNTQEDTKERQKLTRKETWEKIRKRHSELLRFGRKSYSDEVDVWVRRESVYTQTQDEGDTDREIPDDEPLDNVTKWLENDRFEDRPQGLPPRPKNDSMEANARSLPLDKNRAGRPEHLSIAPLTIRSLPSPAENENQAFSPSTASLKLLGAPITPDLGNKSSSAPVIMKQTMALKKDSVKVEGDTKKLILKQPRSQSERHLAEIEAAEACKWLRAAGFPQYAQMFEDLQFPIDVSGVQKDHPFLDKDSLQSLFRRLHALNRCVKMKIDNPPKNSMDDSDEDDQCALSENWTFQPESRRWSRVCDVTNHHVEHVHNNTGSSNTSEEKPDSSIDSDRLMSSGEDLIATEDLPVIESLRYGSLPQGAISADSELIAVRFRRTNSERLRDGAKAILRRMESLKSRRRKKQNVENVSISSPQVLDVCTMQQKMKDLNCVDVSPTATSGSSPEHSSPSYHLPSNYQYLTPPFADDSSSYCSDNSQGTPVYQRPKSKLHRAKRFFHSRKADESGALSDSEIQPTSWKHRYVKDANSNHAKVVDYIDGRPRGPKDQEPPGTSKTPSRGGSLNLGKESQRYREQVQANFRRKGANMYIDKSGSSELTEDSSSTFASHPDSDQDQVDITTKQRVTVVRWHSFQRGSLRPDSYYLNSDSNIPFECRSMSALSCGQLLVLKKMALLKLTACMEKYCPTHRTGWNWELPKFIRKIKTPDYKDKTVFGVPLLLSLQRSGQALPKCIQLALRWLRTNALDQVGLFRKSGVRSRIQTLKAMTENQGEMISYDGHQAYDVADMVKQYFRELPEALLTNKLSETFISIFQHVPETFRGEAVQWALLLLPDEHREALQTVLEFFNQVSARSTCNQMTASNLAVCLAPSLFHLHHPSPGSQCRSASASPRRRKTVGVPDQRELGENRAAHDCLLYLMKENKEVFTVSEDMFTNCRFSTMDYSIPMTLEQLGSELPDGWRGYLKESISSFLREAKEKSRGWVSVPCSLDSHTEMAYKKVGDGHPLRLWKVWTEVEAPPQELVRRVLRERHLWDLNLLKWRVVARLDAQAEIFQFVCGSMPPLPAKDFCVLRSWKTDLPKGACVIVETSVEHPDASVLLGGVRGVVLASRYLIEPCGSGKSRIVHLSRVDTKGRSPEWYNKSYGHICAMHLSRIRTSFKHNTDGPESKV